MHTASKTHNMNTLSERWMRSIKSECLRKIIPFGFRSLDRTISPE